MEDTMNAIAATLLGICCLTVSLADAADKVMPPAAGEDEGL